MTHSTLPFTARWGVRAACVLLLGSSLAFAKDKAPQAPSSDKAGWQFQHRGVASANPLASAAGLRILKAGGSAVDAAIAVQLVLTLVEAEHRISIASELPEGSCLFRQVLAHERRHAAVNRRSLAVAANAARAHASAWAQRAASAKSSKAATISTHGQAGASASSTATTMQVVP